ncbi:MAG: type I-U CRISPR-associated protein Cas5/Cas6 [Planctomycetales bacterium]|nr:type I-U CRISPR-associated protein Cas5/Cas6 [Planctomycetales bacterium]
MNDVHGVSAEFASISCDAPPLPTSAVVRLTIPSRPLPSSDLPVGRLPITQNTLLIADAIHRALIRKAGQGRRVECPELTGQNQWGQPLAGAHRHAHVLPVDLDEDGLLDHVVIHAPMGLGQSARNAIDDLKTLFGPGGTPWLRLTPVSATNINRWLCGASSDVAINHLPLEYRAPHSPSCELGANDWIGLTPFVPPRYLKSSGKNSLAGQVNAELASRSHPPAIVTVLGVHHNPQRRTTHTNRHSDSFVLNRGRNHTPPPQQTGFLLHLRFERPAMGPICLGYASHFGMGLFRASSPSSPTMP